MDLDQIKYNSVEKQKQSIKDGIRSICSDILMHIHTTHRQDWRKKKSIKIELAKIKTNTNGNEIFFPLFQVMRKIVLRFKNFEFGVAT